MAQPRLDRNKEVFICHRRDAAGDRIATDLARLLETEGISVFTDLASIDGGQSFRRRINDTIPDTRLVVAVFAEGYSDWQVAEAGCAFLDAKLMPVCLDIAEPPSPFATLNAPQLHLPDHPEYMTALKALVGEIRKRLRGESRGLRFHIARHLNHAFAGGLPYVYICILPLIILALSNPEDDWHDVAYNVLKYMHVIAGMLTLGGGILLSVGFARAFSSRSYRARQEGFRTANGLYILWLITAVLTFALGLSVTFAGGWMHATWVQYSINLYLMALIFWGGGYFFVYRAHGADRDHDIDKFVYSRMVASLAFLVAFVLTVLVVDLMLFQPDGGIRNEAGSAVNAD